MNMAKIKKKTLIILFIFIIAALIFPRTAFMAATDTIRVKISISGAKLSVQLDGEYTVSEKPDIALNRGVYTVSVSGANVRLQGNGVNTVTGSSLTFIRHPSSKTGNNYMTLNNTAHGNVHYLGDMIFTVSSGNLVAINRLPMEEYLYGVVAYEMSNAFPLEALKVQAVCARGYAVKSLSPSSSYDIGDTSSDQVYRGYNPAHTNVIAAVDATKGQVLTYKGKVVSTYYSASNGGQTELPGNQWGGGAAKNAQYPYLAQKDDPYDLENPSSLYQKIFVPAQVEGSEYDIKSLPGSSLVRIVQCMQSCNVRSGPGTSYALVGSAPVNTVYTWISTSGAWHRVDFNGTPAYISTDYALKIPNGNYIYTNSVLADLQKNACAALKTAGTSISSPTDVKIIKVNSLANSKEYWPGTGSRCYVAAKANLSVKYLAAGATELSDSTTINTSIALMNPSGSGYALSHEYLMSSLRMRGVQPASDGYYVTNGRYGHGVGMSQRGAQTMASSSHNIPYNQILAFYFPGTAITTLDSTPVPPPPAKNAPIISMGKYKLTNNIITGLSYNLDAGAFLSQISVQKGSFKLLNASKKQKTSGAVVTGDVLSVAYADAAPYKSYPLVIYGDVNADGKISLVDLLRIQKHLLGTSALSGAYKTAADVSKDGAVTILDLLRVQKHLLGTAKIAQ